MLVNVTLPNGKTVQITNDSIIHTMKFMGTIISNESLCASIKEQLSHDNDYEVPLTDGAFKTILAARDRILEAE